MIRLRFDMLSEVYGGLPPAQPGGVSPAQQRPCVGSMDCILAAWYAGARPDDTLSVLDDDYSERMHLSVVDTFTQLFTIDGEVARAELAQVMAKVHTYLGVGASAVQKAGALLHAGALSSLCLILRDPVHSLRTSTSEPIKAHAQVYEFWDDISGKPWILRE